MKFKPKFSLSWLLIAITCCAFFFAGWIGHGKYLEYEAARAKEAVDVAVKQDLGTNAGQLKYITSKLRGLITKLDKNFIAISLGTNDGLQAGQMVEITRGKELIGRAQTVRCTHNMSAARLLPEFTKAKVLKGDQVRPTGSKIE